MSVGTGVCENCEQHEELFEVPWRGITGDNEGKLVCERCAPSFATPQALAAVKLANDVWAFGERVQRDAERAGRPLDVEEVATLSGLVWSYLGLGPARTPPQKDYEAWVVVLDRLVAMGYLSLRDGWYRPTLAGFRRAILELEEEAPHAPEGQ